MKKRILATLLILLLLTTIFSTTAICLSVETRNKIIDDETVETNGGLKRVYVLAREYRPGEAGHWPPIYPMTSALITVTGITYEFEDTDYTAGNGMASFDLPAPGWYDILCEPRWRPTKSTTVFIKPPNPFDEYDSQSVHFNYVKSKNKAYMLLPNFFDLLLQIVKPRLL